MKTLSTILGLEIKEALCDTLAEDFHNGYNACLDDLDEFEIDRKSILEILRTIGSAYHPITKINGKIYHYMNKEELVDKIIYNADKIFKRKIK